MQDKFIPISQISRLACQKPSSQLLSHENADYLSRMNLFNVWRLDYQESFERFPEEGRFIPLIPLTNEKNLSNFEDQVIELILKNMALKNPRETIGYIEVAIAEILCNIVEHSESSRAFGIAQIHPKNRVLKIAISDNGIGFAGSFGCKSKEAIQKALSVGVSSKGGSRGMGLCILMDAVSKNKGSLRVYSEDHMYDFKNNRFMDSKEPYTGVSIGISFNLDNDFSHESPIPQDKLSFIVNDHCYFDREGVEKLTVTDAHLRSIASKLKLHVCNLEKAGLKSKIDCSKIRTSVSHSFLSELREIRNCHDVSIEGLNKYGPIV